MENKASILQRELDGLRAQIASLEGDLAMLQEGQKAIQLNGVRVAAAATIPPHYFFIGVESAGDNGRGRPRKKRRRSTKAKR